MEVIIEYKVKADKADEAETLRSNFFAGLKGQPDAEISYRSLSKPDGASFVHLAWFANQDALSRFQSTTQFCQMGLYRADAHLGYARLDLAMADKPEAREHLATAKEMIERMGYHRRDGEVVELEERLKAG